MIDPQPCDQTTTTMWVMNGEQEKVVVRCILERDHLHEFHLGVLGSRVIRWSRKGGDSHGGHEGQ